MRSKPATGVVVERRCGVDLGGLERDPNGANTASRAASQPLNFKALARPSWGTERIE
jgi:hypothetical protein